MVTIEFKADDNQVLTELNALDFGLVQAGTSSAIRTVTVKNTGSSDAQQCVIDPKAATIVNGFVANIQVGTDAETWQAQKFAADAQSGSWYSYAVLGVGKNYTNKTGGTLQNTSGTDNFATKWQPPSDGTSGQKSWGNAFTCVYV